MSQCLRVLTTVVAALFVASCQTPTQDSKPSEPTPVATTTTVADIEGVIPRFSQDIWPAINAYRAEMHQGSPGYQQYNRIIYWGQDTTPEQHGRLRAAVEELGQRRREDWMNGKISGDLDLTLVDASLVELGVESGVIQACYTYTTATYPHGYSQPPVKNPAASEATVELRKADNWYLYAITNDHVVPGCSASSRT